MPAPSLQPASSAQPRGASSRSNSLAGRPGRPGVLVVAVVAALAAGQGAIAAPMFYFQATSGTTMQQEVIGDPGGTAYAPAVWPAGQGLPTALGGWPTSPTPPGFAADVSFGGNLGISGYHTANLWISDPAYVTFTFMGKGDAALVSQFKVNGTVIYDSTTSGSNPTAPFFFAGGLLPFTYVANVTSSGTTPTYTIVNGSNTANPVDGAAFFLAFDPYTAAGTFTSSGTGSVYIGLSDRAEVAADHDFQDLSIKVSIVGVPEPSAVALAVPAAAAASGFAVVRRRRARGNDRRAAAAAAPGAPAG